VIFVRSDYYRRLFFITKSIFLAENKSEKRGRTREIRARKVPPRGKGARSETGGALTATISAESE
jgi:hypothetical protein